MNEPAHVREYLRQVLSLARKDEHGKRKPMSMTMLHEGVRRLCREPLKVDEFQKAWDWNEARDYVASEHDDVADEQAGWLTKQGLEKEGVK